MLVLSRREGEWIKVGESVTVTVVRLGSDKVRIGIEAPANVLILRGELEQRSSIDNNGREEKNLVMERIELSIPMDSMTITPSATSLAG